MMIDSAGKGSPRPRPRRSDGERTRRAILSAAASLATVDGLEGLSIGNLAAATRISKSGLYAHFGSKLELQLATVEEAERILDEEVVQPALAADPGLGQLAAACEAFLSYVERRVFPGGCFFAATSLEMGARPGPVRDRLAAVQSDFTALLRSFAATALEQHELPPTRTPTGSRSSSTRSCWVPTPSSSCTTTPQSWSWPARSSTSDWDWTRPATPPHDATPREGGLAGMPGQTRLRVRSVGSATRNDPWRWKKWAPRFVRRVGVTGHHRTRGVTRAPRTTRAEVWRVTWRIGVGGHRRLSTLGCEPRSGLLRGCGLGAL